MKKGRRKTLLPTSKKLFKALDFFSKICYNIPVRRKYRDVAQLVARLVWDQDVAGSNPVIPTK